MSLPKKVTLAIREIEKYLSAPLIRERDTLKIYSAVSDLFASAEDIVVSEENLQPVLALAPKIESFRGKGSQMAQHGYARGVC